MKERTQAEHVADRLMDGYDRLWLIDEDGTHYPLSRETVEYLIEDVIGDE